jgi:hypothetical protein
MGEHVKGLNRSQTALFPDTLEGYVDEENRVRFIDAFIDGLNWKTRLQTRITQRCWKTIIRSSRPA